MNIFEQVKWNLSTRQVAESYGIPIGRNGMCRCIFHEDHNPSMKVDERYYCFGCGATGDVIDFTAQLFHLEPYEAAKKLVADFGLDTSGKITSIPKEKVQMQEKFAQAKKLKEEETQVFGVLCEYLRLLKDWRERYAPESPEDSLHDCFVESLQMMSTIEFYLDEMLLGDLEERVMIVDRLKELIPGLQQRINRYHEKYGFPEKKEGFMEEVMRELEQEEQMNVEIA